MATQPPLVIGADGLPQRLQAGDDLGTALPAEADGLHLSSTDLPSTYALGYSTAHNNDATGWTTVVPGNLPFRWEMFRSANNGATMRVTYRDQGNYPITKTRIAPGGANAWGPWRETATLQPAGTQTLTYTSGVLTRVGFPDGSYRTLTYTSGVLTQVDSVAGGVTTRRTLTYTGGVLTSTTTAVI